MRRLAVFCALLVGLAVMGDADAKRLFKTDIDQISGTVTNGRVVEVRGLVTNQKTQCVEARHVEVGNRDGIYGETTTTVAGPDFGKRAAAEFKVTGDGPPGDYYVYARSTRVGRVRCGPALFGKTIQ